MPEAWTTKIVPEGKEVIDDWSIVGNKAFLSTASKMSNPETSIYTLDGKP